MQAAHGVGGASGAAVRAYEPPFSEFGTTEIACDDDDDSPQFGTVNVIENWLSTGPTRFTIIAYTKALIPFGQPPRKTMVPGIRVPLTDGLDKCQCILDGRNGTTVANEPGTLDWIRFDVDWLLKG